MTREAPAPIVLDPEQEALRLWQGAERGHGRARDDLVALCEALDLGTRAAQILAVERLQEVRRELPATVAALLDHPPPEVDPWRDVVHLPKTLRFAEVVDLLSGEELECITPHLHHGWEDRRFSCRRSRRLAHQAAGFALTGDERTRLMVLAAYRNRLFETPPPVQVDPIAILEAFPELRRLVERLRAGGSRNEHAG